jgi:uncharacterized protein YjbI with pentapeptide repeats
LKSALYGAAFRGNDACRVRLEDARFKPTEILSAAVGVTGEHKRTDLNHASLCQSALSSASLKLANISQGDLHGIIAEQ